jgi:cob(I)alamin adenosyltransferase
LQRLRDLNKPKEDKRRYAKKERGAPVGAPLSFAGSKMIQFCRHHKTDSEVTSMTPPWITTKGGDKGTTSLGNGERVPKDHPRVELYGTLDECQAAIGVARATSCAGEIADELFRIEEQLGSVMGHLALYPGLGEPSPKPLEEIIERVKSVTGETIRFVRPGDTLPGAALHMARTIARRAERTAVKLYREGEIAESTYAYINRLSDAIYALALWTDHITSGCRGDGN